MSKLLVSAVLLCVPLGSAASEAIRVGVMSPVGDSSAGIGSAHDTSIRAGAELGGEIVIGNRRFRLDPIYARDSKEPGACAHNARGLLEQNVVAILGPVRTDCTLEVLAESLDVPILTTLSTVTLLTPQRSPWLFRMAPIDQKRVSDLFTFAKSKGTPGAALVLYDDSSAYGKGLRADLRPLLDDAAMSLLEMTWKEARADSHDPRSGLRTDLLSQLPSLRRASEERTYRRFA